MGGNVQDAIGMGPNSRWPSTFALKGRPYRIWKAVISVGLVELLKMDILEAT